MSVLSAGLPVAVLRLTYATYNRPWYGLKEPSGLSAAMPGAGPTPRSGDTPGFSGNVPLSVPRTVVVATDDSAVVCVVPDEKRRPHSSRCCSGGGGPFGTKSVISSVQVPDTSRSFSPSSDEKVPTSGLNVPV